MCTVQLACRLWRTAWWLQTATTRSDGTAICSHSGTQHTETDLLNYENLQSTWIRKSRTIFKDAFERLRPQQIKKCPNSLPIACGYTNCPCICTSVDCNKTAVCLQQLLCEWQHSGKRRNLLDKVEDVERWYETMWTRFKQSYLNSCFSVTKPLFRFLALCYIHPVIATVSFSTVKATDLKWVTGNGRRITALIQ